MVRLGVGMVLVVVGGLAVSCNNVTNACDCPSCSHPAGACGDGIPDGGVEAAMDGAADATTDATTDGATDAAPDSGAPVADCVQQGDVFVCHDSDAATPVCPASANPQQPCDGGAPTCMGCEFVLPTTGLGAGFFCLCRGEGVVQGQDAALWQCIGTEHTCQ